MNILLSILFLVSMTLAEPPVGDSYPAARSSHDHHHNYDHSDYNDHHTSEIQRFLPEEYGPPPFASSRNRPSTGYNTPNAKSSQNSIGRSQFASPKVRVSFNQRFSSATARNSAKDNTSPSARSLSAYAAPNTRSGISQEYGPPAARSLSQEYGVPSVVSARTLSTEYGMPDARSTPSQEYGVPVVAARSNQKPRAPAFSFRSAQPAKSSGAPSSRSLSTSYGTPSARSFEYDDSISQTYGVPSQNDLSETYGAPSARGVSKEYGVPSTRSSQMTDAVASAYTPASSRSTPASSYLPSARDIMPSQQYGVPEQDKNQGYDYAKARALDELLNQEPANYDFAYQIEDQESGNDFGHTETREEGRAQGSYFVVLPDGTKQTVEYEADERGFKPRISVEPAAGGYDENAADIDLARSAEGPY